MLRYRKRNDNRNERGELTGIRKNRSNLKPRKWKIRNERRLDSVFANLGLVVVYKCG